MSSLSHRYHDFGSAAGTETGAKEAAREDEKLQSFEAGYQAGWEDAVKAHASAQHKAVQDIAQTLQDLSFTYHEAHAQLCMAMRPLLQQIVGKVLPIAAHATLGQQVTELLAGTLSENAEGGIEIVVAPDQLDPVQQVLNREVKLPFLLTAEPALGAGQVYLRASRQEREINLDAVLEGMAAALDSFFLQSSEESSRG